MFLYECHITKNKHLINCSERTLLSDLYPRALWTATKPIFYEKGWKGCNLFQRPTTRSVKDRGALLDLLRQLIKISWDKKSTKTRSCLFGHIW